MAQIKFIDEGVGIRESADAPWMVYLSEETVKKLTVESVKDACTALAAKAIMDLIQVACLTAQTERESFVEALEKLLKQHQYRTEGDCHSVIRDLMTLLKEVKAAV